MLRVGLKTKVIKQFFIIFFVVLFTHTTTASALTFPLDAEIDNARAEIAQSKKELAAAQEVLKQTTEELNKAIAEDKRINRSCRTNPSRTCCGRQITFLPSLG